jgi:hypothetical protein
MQSVQVCTTGLRPRSIMRLITSLNHSRHVGLWPVMPSIRYSSHRSGLVAKGRVILGYASMQEVGSVVALP